MKKIILTFGLISGVVSALMMVTTVPFADRIGFDKSTVVGYTSIVLSFLLVFFGIRSYRDGEGGGQITFAKAFAVGICISDFVPLLCRDLGSSLLQLPPWFHGQIQRPRNRQSPGLGRECGSRRDASSATEEIQGAVRQSSIQRSDDVH